MLTPGNASDVVDVANAHIQACYANRNPNPNPNPNPNQVGAATGLQPSRRGRRWLTTPPGIRPGGRWRVEPRAYALPLLLTLTFPKPKPSPAPKPYP